MTADVTLDKDKKADGFVPERMNTKNKELTSNGAENTCAVTLKQARVSLGKTQLSTAQELGMGQPALCRIEQGERPIPETKLDSFSRAYGMTLDQVKAFRETRLTKMLRGPIDADMEVLPIIKWVAQSNLSSLTFRELCKLLSFTRRLQSCSPSLITELLQCGIKE